MTRYKVYRNQLNRLKSVEKLHRLKLAGSSGHKKKRAREEETREGRGNTPRLSPSRAPVLSFAHYFQAPATQAKPIFSEASQ